MELIKLPLVELVKKRCKVSCYVSSRVDSGRNPASNMGKVSTKMEFIRFMTTAETVFQPTVI